jgi:hypothetical protein
LQTALGVERQLPKNTTVAVNIVDSHSPHQLLTRNINAPLPDLGIQPFGTGNIYQYESAGLANQTQIMINVRTQATQNLSLFGYYVNGHSRSNTDGSFPANQYNLSQDYGRSSMDERHRVVASGSISMRWRLRWSPFVIIRSGRPFNITTGRDPYGNSVYTARPSFAGSCGGGYSGPRGGSRGGGPSGGGYRGSGRGGPRGGGEGLTNRRFNLALSISARNLFNTVNPGTPIGNLGSPLFGQSNQIAGGFGPTGMSADNRRVEMTLRFSF